MAWRRPGSGQARSWLPRVRFGFPRVGPQPAQGLAEELTEHNLYIKQYALLTSGIVSPEWDPSGDGKSWARMRLKARIKSVQRVGGNRDVYVQQDARHLQWAEGASKTISANATSYYDATLNVPIRPAGKLGLSVFPWLGLTADDSRTQTGSLGSGDWRYVGYISDVVTYAADLEYTADVESSVAAASGTRQRHRRDVLQRAAGGGPAIRGQAPPGGRSSQPGLRGRGSAPTGRP